MIDLLSSEVVREVYFETSGEFVFKAKIDSLGWSQAEDLLFATLHVCADTPPALVSFGLKNEDDWYEGLLPDDAKGYEDGFVLAPGRQ